MKRIIWKLIGPSNYSKVRHSYQLFVDRHLLGNWDIYYSQMGEDMILKNLFQNKPTGFFVDIGAYHPVELSNTFYFYKKGWRGINVDATPGSMEKFNLLRPRDVNLEMGVADIECEKNYFLFRSKALNTFTHDGVKYAKQQFNVDPFKVVKIKFMPLNKILDTYLPPLIKEIDFLSIDVEGADEMVLRSNDFEKFKPKVICIERHLNYTEFDKSPLCSFLKSHGYHFAAKTGPSYFYYLND